MTRPLFVGFTDDREHPTDEPARLPTVRVHLTEEERATGMHVIGAPGTGKSKFLEHCIRQDIREGRGVCVIDPHGELYDEVLKWCAYVRPHREIIPLNLSEGQHVIGFNAFASDGAGDVHASVNRNIEATVKGWGIKDTDETPTLERILRCIYHAITENKLTIAEARHLLFDNDQVRDYLTGNISDDVIRAEWRELAAASSRDRREEFRSTKNKLLRFLTARSVLRFLSLTESIDLRRIMDEGAVLLVRLGLKKHTLDAMDARLFGALLVSKFFDVARDRGGLGQPKPRPFYLYCDEFQNFVSPDVAEILPQGRKFGLSLILAHQFLGQLNAEDARLVEAVMAAARTKVVFGGLSYADATAMVNEIFAGQIDYHEVKRIEYTTQFWPVYGRETVTTKSTTRGGAHLESDTETDATSSTFSHQDGLSTPDFPGVGIGTRTAADVAGGGDVHSAGHTTADQTNWTEGETVADVPFYYQERHDVPEKEYWTSEEQKERLAHVLMLQLTRNCFVKPRDGRTVPVLVPMVKPYPLPVASVLDYEAEQATKAGAITPAQADAITTERTKQLEHQAREFAAHGPIPVHSKDDEPQQPTTKPTKRIRPSPTLKPATRKAKPPEGSDGAEG